MKRSMTAAVLVAAAATSGACAVWGFGPRSAAADRVREGLRHFGDGQWEQAAQAFADADVSEPENPIIAFDRGCVEAASGDAEAARQRFEQAALARDVNLAARSQYNLGCVAAQLAKAALGPEPAEAKPEQREQGLSHLFAAVGHYRDCLNLDAGHENARHNLELIRLFIKHIQSVWDERDRQQSREELGLLEFLALIQRRQSELRETVRNLEGEMDSPQRRQAAQEAADGQSQLREEIEPLKEKIVASFGSPPAGATPSQPPPPKAQAEQAKTLLSQLADQAGESMVKAASFVEQSTFSDAARAQRDALDGLNQIYMAAAPFADVLQRATVRQEELVAVTEAATAAEEPQEPDQQEDQDDKPGDDASEKQLASTDPANPADSESPLDLAEQAWRQSYVTDWSRILSLKAEAELPALQEQLSNKDAASDDKDSKKPSDPALTSPEATAQMEAMKQSLQRAVKLAPKVTEHSSSAAESLKTQHLAKALPDQQEALRLLREIAEPLSQSKNDQNDQNQQQRQDGDQKNQQKDRSASQQKSSDQQQKQQQNNEQQNQAKQSEQNRQRQATSVLRRARERERRHRDLQKQMQQMIGGRVRVERDW